MLAAIVIAFRAMTCCDTGVRDRNGRSVSENARFHTHATIQTMVSQHFAHITARVEFASTAITSANPAGSIRRVPIIQLLDDPKYQIRQEAYDNLHLARSANVKRAIGRARISFAVTNKTTVTFSYIVSDADDTTELSPDWRTPRLLHRFHSNNRRRSLYRPPIKPFNRHRQIVRHRGRCDPRLIHTPKERTVHVSFLRCHPSCCHRKPPQTVTRAQPTAFLGHH
jgi:hypothetical protein